MNFKILKKPSSIIIIILCFILIFIIWQPVLPSGWIIKGMADSIDVKSLSLDNPVVVRYELGGRGGGDYNIVVDKTKAEVTEGDSDKIDLLIKMDAAEFNNLMISMAQGKADENMFKSLVISNKLKIAGDMTVMQKLFSSKGGKK